MLALSIADFLTTERVVLPGGCPSFSARFDSNIHSSLSLLLDLAASLELKLSGRHVRCWTERRTTGLLVSTLLLLIRNTAVFLLPLYMQNIVATTAVHAEHSGFTDILLYKNRCAAVGAPIEERDVSLYLPLTERNNPGTYCLRIQLRYELVLLFYFFDEKLTSKFGN